MTQALDQSIVELLHASRDDEATLPLPVSDRVFGFHAQQAVEKLLEALIGAHGERFQLTHDLGVLLRHAVALGETLPVDHAELEALTGYASVWRYQEPQPIPAARRDEFQALVSGLRVRVQSRLLVLRPDLESNAGV